MATKDTLSKSLPNSSKTFSCDQCEKVFHHLTKLQSHKRAHANPQSVTCDVCKKVFAHRASLIRHKRIHTGIRPFKCPICTMRFTQGSHMRRHVKLIHNSDQKKESKTVAGNKCDACGLGFKTAKGLKIHKKTHEPSKGPFNCEICAMSFEYSDQLTQHQKGHKKPFVCKVCKKSFSSITHLSVHAVIHNRKLPYSCEYCGEKFRLKGHVKRHEMTAHVQDKQNELPESKLSLASERKLPNSDKNTNKIDHILNPISTKFHENENQLEQLSPDSTNVISKKNIAPSSCNQIRKETDKIIAQCNDSSENNQIESDKNKTTICDSATCKISEKSDKSHSTITESLCENPEETSNLEVEKPKVKANQCDICFKTFKQKSYVKSHKRTHTGEKLYSCKCGKSYTFAHRLRSHRKSGKCSIKPAEIPHTESSAFKSPDRKKICKSDSSLKIHEKRQEKKVQNSETFQCRFCSKNFPSKDSMDKHEKKAHKGNKRYQCDLCDKTFKLGAHVANHKKRVHGEGRKSGRKNKKKLASSTDGCLQKCETSSPNENPIAYDCEFCGKSFSRENQLLGHKKIHKPKESFECQTCAKAFKNWNNLYRHELVHNGEKPFVCWVCGKACTQKSNLKSHMNRIHGMSDLVMPVRSEVVSSSDQLHEIQTEVSRVNGNTRNTFKGDDMLTRCNESQLLASTSQLCIEVEEDLQCITNSPRLPPLHDEDTGLTQQRPRVSTERNLFTELKLRKRRHCSVDSTTEDSSNSKKYASEMSDVVNNNNQETRQNQQQQQKQSGFKEGNLLEKLNAELDRLSANFLRSENVCNREQPFYLQSNTSLQSSSIAEHESSYTRFQTEAKADNSWNGSAEVFKHADSSREKFEAREVSREVEGHHDTTFVCCECGQKFDDENTMIKHCVNAH